jgi:hypothetical protein
MADKVAKKSGSSVGLGIDFSLNPCSSLFLILILPPFLTIVWFFAR